jgi:acetyltransferase-like isoleucine patch superfamily enzyme
MRDLLGFPRKFARATVKRLAQSRILHPDAMTATPLRNRLLRLLGMRIGEPTLIDHWLEFWDARTIVIGRNVLIRHGCYLGGNIRIEDGVMLSPYVQVHTGGHHPGTREVICAPVSIGEYAWVGARATILPGVSIGRCACVAAGAVVNRDVPACTLVAGVPARVVHRYPAPSSVWTQFGRFATRELGVASDRGGPDHQFSGRASAPADPVATGEVGELPLRAEPEFVPGK